MTSLLAGDSLGRARIDRSETPIAPGKRPFRPLARGSCGLAVRELQKKLVTLKYLNPQDAAGGAGVFGPRTEAAVKAFQDENGLRATGQVGQYTNDAIEKALTRPRHLGAAPKLKSSPPGDITAPQSARQLEHALQGLQSADVLPVTHQLERFEPAAITASLPSVGELQNALKGLSPRGALAETVLNVAAIVPDRPTVVARPAVKPSRGDAMLDAVVKPSRGGAMLDMAVRPPRPSELEGPPRSDVFAAPPAPRTHAARYAEAINLLQVVSNPRYAQPGVGGLRFVQDVAAAMNAEIPTTYKGHPLTAKGLADWMHVAGADAGWLRADAKQAQSHANTGRPALAVLGSEGLLAVIRPGELTSAGPTVAHAGPRNFNHGHAARAFGTAEPEYFIHP